MGMSWDIVIIGLVCTCIGLWAGWGIYHEKMGLLRMEIKVLKRELSDERARCESFSRTADEWRGAVMRAETQVERLKHEKALVQKALAHSMLGDGIAQVDGAPTIGGRYWTSAKPNSGVPSIGGKDDSKVPGGHRPGRQI